MNDPCPQPPSLFAFATSELSQDAFVAWLASWADPAHREFDPNLHATAVRWLEDLLTRCSVPQPVALNSVRVARQVNYIDVLVSINETLAIIIEDKTHTSDPASKLRGYVAGLNGQFPDGIAAVYLKTGNQCNLSEIEQAGFRYFGRRDFLALLDTGITLGVRNDIFLDFTRHLRRIEDWVQCFRTMAPDNWDDNQWTGFFMAIREELQDGGWGYVPNRSGGFIGFWWHWRDATYIQLEYQKLCFKVEVDDTDDTIRQSAWDRANTSILQAGERLGLSLQRPRRRLGTWMTVAVLPTDYRRVTSEGTIDIPKIVELLRTAEAILDAAAGSS